MISVVTKISQGKDVIKFYTTKMKFFTNQLVNSYLPISYVIHLVLTKAHFKNNIFLCYKRSYIKRRSLKRRSVQTLELSNAGVSNVGVFKCKSGSNVRVFKGQIHQLKRVCYLNYEKKSSNFL